MRGLGDPLSVYRVEIEPAHDSINTYLFARVIDSMQCPRLTTATVPRGNRWTVTFNLKEGLGNRYRGPLELFATGLPDGVQMIVPPILPGQSSVPVQFVASDDVQPQSALIEVHARAANVVQAARLQPRRQRRHDSGVSAKNPSHSSATPAVERGIRSRSIVTCWPLQNGRRSRSKSLSRASR